MTKDEKLALTNAIDGIRENIVNVTKAHFHYLPDTVQMQLRAVEGEIEDILSWLER